uniref:Uncharacterized protein n=1 Tax=Oncorhynchus mykiss TaxID=8022 RepID=A0A8K9VBZ9_ONCMY
MRHQQLSSDRSPGPAFSFGMRHQQLSSDRSPGPAFSFGMRHQQLSSDRSPGPAFSFGMRHQQLSSDRSPGPAFSFGMRHQQLSSDRSPGPAFSFGMRHQQLSSDRSPGMLVYLRNVIVSFRSGPAAYMQPSVLGPATVNKTSTPNFSRRGCSKMVSFHEDLQKVDLTWTFRVVDPCTYKQKPPHYSMTGCNSMPGDTTMKPAARLPFFTFKIHHSEFIAPLIVDVV